ncbi:MAG: 3-oxoacyl-[acyl-carrier-protein] reductase [Clostridia bacterium]|nr:3-oxoacyl-[acyl-carrier-protein] reductase [Clostridia bacterium]MBT7122241.1 3-oxoacyl-[acyl-carrier-protein] reductase [Clostridia bacterium]
MELGKKVAVVTGSARGLGKAIAAEFLEQGATVVITDINQESIDKTVDELKAYGEVFGLVMDVTDIGSVQAGMDTIVEKYHKIDILVNNAGITNDGLLMRMSDNDFDSVISVNLKGTFNATKTVSQYMLKQRSGNIINISSVVGITGNIGQANYSASKAGVIGLTKTSAKEFAKRGIRVNAIAPGFIKTDMTDKLSDAAKESLQKSIPLGRLGLPRDVANAAAFLAGDNASYITGQVLVVDGGMVT